MNLEESNSFVEEMEKNNKKKKKVITVLIICAILIVILLCLIQYLKYKDSQVLKMFIDDTQAPISSTLLVQDENTSYMNVRELANMLGYSYQKGEYKNYTEDSNSCYLKNQYEIISMTAESSTVTKYIMNENAPQLDEDGNVISNNTVEQTATAQTEDANMTQNQTISVMVESENETPETFVVEEPIRYINNELYISFAELPRIFNVQLDMSKTNRIKLYSLNYLIASATQIASNLGYSQVSNTYENLTAMVDHMLVVGNGNNYGVVSIENGQEIISLKYEKMVYMQNTKEFLVTAEDSVGIIASDGTTIIKPTEFESITTLDELHKLYLVQKDSKYGVLNGEGDTIVYAEYDKIGIEDEKEFQEENIRNFKLLFDECIPVMANGKMGLIDIEGNERLKCVYESLGYVASTTARTSDEDEEERSTSSFSRRDDDEEEEENVTNTSNTTTNKVAELNEHDSVLTIPESLGIKGIVVNLNGLYGIYDVQAKRLIIPCACTKIYSKTKSGVTNYYLEYNEQEIELDSYLEANNLKNNNSSNIEENQDSYIENNSVVDENQE